MMTAGALFAADPTVEQRLADLEAYVKNSGPGLTALKGVPGPGHNAWLMVSAGMVLFMTLPGLALFYGGLVRRKNVLSVLAQCLGLAGLVTVLNVDSPATGATDPFAAAKVGFANAKAATAAAAGANAAVAVTAAYHGGLVPPFCNAAARGFFSQF